MQSDVIFSNIDCLKRVKVSNSVIVRKETLLVNFKGVIDIVKATLFIVPL